MTQPDPFLRTQTSIDCNTISTILSAFAVATLLFTVNVTFASLARAEEVATPLGPAPEKPPEHTHGAQPIQTACPKPLPVPRHQVLFQDLKGINLYIQLPPNDEEAIECHGHEESCLSHAGGYGSPHFDQTQYIQELKDHYDAYPKALLPQNIAQLFQYRIQRFLFPVLVRDDQCRVPDIIILNQKTASQYVHRPNTLTVTAKLQIIDSTRPRLAVLSSSFFRPDCGHANYDDSGSITTVIPLDLSDDDISLRAAEFANHLPLKVDNETF